MTVLRVFKHGDKVLKTPCPKVEYSKIKDELPQILKNMWSTMIAARGVGLAAPQIGMTLRLAVIDVKPEGKSNRIVLINPEIIEKSGEINDEEGCLSIPGIYARLTRYEKVKVRAMDGEGKMYEMMAQGLLARAFQHEIDHLDGKLYIDRLPFEQRLEVLDVIKSSRGQWS